LLQITRSLARQLRSVFRRLVSRQNVSAVSLQAGADGLRVRLHAPEVAAEYHQPGAFPAEQLTVNLDVLAETEGRDDSPVVLEKVGTDAVRARWTDSGIPLVRDVASPDISKWQAFPQIAPHLASNPPGLLSALDEAMHCSANESVRYVTEKIQLRGSGVVVATDGRQLFWQDGFHFPWEGKDVLVPAVKVFGAKEISRDQPVTIGKNESHVSVLVGPWTFFFLADDQGRFPNVEQILSSASQSRTRWQLDPEDGAFLAKALHRLPCGDSDHAVVTVDLNGAVAIRAKAETQANPNELILSRSTTSGDAATMALRRDHLARALRLGFTQMQQSSAGSPVLWLDEHRKYLLAPMSKESVIPPSPHALRVFSGAETSTNPQRKERTMSMAQTNNDVNDGAAANSNGTSNGESSNGASSVAKNLIEEAQMLRTLLRGGYERAGRLISAIRQHDKRTKTLRAALASLRQLQQVGA